MKRQHVCRSHGGSSPQALAAVHRRALEEMVGPALARLMEHVRDYSNPAVSLAATRDVLDRNGFKAIEKIQQDGRTVIEIEYLNAPHRSLSDPTNPLVPAYRNGAS